MVTRGEARLRHFNSFQTLEAGIEFVSHSADGACCRPAVFAGHRTGIFSTRSDVMTRMINEAARKAEGDYTEGGLARPLDKVTGQLPSDTFLWLGWGSVAASLTLKLMGRDKDANFVGQ